MRPTRLRGWLATWPGILVATAVACVAWALAEVVLRHPQPTFAATAAIVCLAPGVASRGRQALGFVFGVGVGTLIGLAEVRFLGTRNTLWIVALAAPAMIAASVVGSSAITVIQAGATAILLATGSLDHAGAHFADAALGAGLSLLVSQVFLSPNAVRLLEDRSREMFAVMATALTHAAQAMEDNDGNAARIALGGFDEAMRHATDLTAAIDAARGLERWTVRGRWSRTRVERLVNRYDREAIRLCASALLFGEALVASLPSGAAPEEIAARVAAARDACRSLAAGGSPPPLALAPMPSPPSAWAGTSQALDATLQALDDLLFRADAT